MGCSSCKKKGKEINESNDVIQSENKTLMSANNIVFKLFTFIMSMIILPFTYPIAVVALFYKIFLRDDMNLMPALVKIGMLIKHGFKGKEEEIEDEEDHLTLMSENPDDYEVVGVDEITR